MKNSSSYAVLGLGAVLALAACGGATSADADGDGEITQDEVNAAVADVKINPGEWENPVEFVDIEFDESQLPPEAKGFMGPMLEQMRGQVNTTKDCVTEEEASKPEANMFAGNENADCKYDKFAFSGGNIEMAMTCNDATSGTAKFESTGTYTADNYNMDMKIVMEGSEIGPMTISAKTTGKRVGECSE